MIRTVWSQNVTMFHITCSLKLTFTSTQLYFITRTHFHSRSLTVAHSKLLWLTLAHSNSLSLPHSYVWTPKIVFISITYFCLHKLANLNLLSLTFSHSKLLSPAVIQTSYHLPLLTETYQHLPLLTETYHHLSLPTQTYHHLPLHTFPTYFSAPSSSHYSSLLTPFYSHLLSLHITYII